MTNPYRDPTAAVSDIPVRRTTVGGILLSLGLGSSLLTALILTFVVPSFGKVFESFGAELPLASYLVLNFYWAVWVFPITVLIVFYRWPTPGRRPLWAFLVGGVGAFIIVPLSFAALYYPVFVLAAAS